MTHDELLQVVVAKLDRSDTPDSKWPDAKGEYWSLCPFHADNSVGPSRYPRAVFAVSPVAHRGIYANWLSTWG